MAKIQKNFQLTEEALERYNQIKNQGAFSKDSEVFEFILMNADIQALYQARLAGKMISNSGSEDIKAIQESVNKVLHNQMKIAEYLVEHVYKNLQTINQSVIDSRDGNIQLQLSSDLYKQISAINQENQKLKAENEELKGKDARTFDMYSKLNDENTSLKKDCYAYKKRLLELGEEI